MGKVYSRRRRVETALNHQEPDRVPCDLTTAPPAYMGLCEYLHVPLSPIGGTTAIMLLLPVEVLEKLDVDIMHFSANAFCTERFFH